MKGYTLTNPFFKRLNSYEKIETVELKDGKHYIRTSNYKRAGMRGGTPITIDRSNIKRYTII